MKDKTGVERGACTDCEECGDFKPSLGEGDYRCGYCGHFPVRHPKISPPHGNVAQAALQSGVKCLAFYAALSHHLGPLPANNAIPFDRVITDTHNVYDPSTGVFTVPSDGVYELGLNIKAQAREFATAEIIVNEERYCSAYIENAPDFRSESNTVILQLKTGDKVFCRTRASHTKNYFYGNMHMYCNFHGKLLY